MSVSSHKQARSQQLTLGPLIFAGSLFLTLVISIVVNSANRRLEQGLPVSVPWAAESSAQSGD